LISAGTSSPSSCIHARPWRKAASAGSRPATSQPKAVSRTDAIDHVQAVHSAYSTTFVAVSLMLLNSSSASCSTARLQRRRALLQSAWYDTTQAPTPNCDQTVKRSKITYLASRGVDRLSASPTEKITGLTTRCLQASAFRAWGRGTIRGTGNCYRWTGRHVFSRLHCTSCPLQLTLQHGMLEFHPGRLCACRVDAVCAKLSLWSRFVSHVDALCKGL
jgi:hypothetical protein